MKQAALEINEETLKQLSVCLEATLSPDKQQRKEGKYCTGLALGKAYCRPSSALPLPSYPTLGLGLGSRI